MAFAALFADFNSALSANRTDLRFIAEFFLAVLISVLRVRAMSFLRGGAAYGLGMLGYQRNFQRE